MNGPYFWGMTTMPKSDSQEPVTPIPEMYIQVPSEVPHADIVTPGPSPVSSVVAASTQNNVFDLLT